MDLDQLAAQLFNRKRAESQQVLTDATTRTYIGTATADSHDGMVTVTLNGYETPAEDMGETQGYGSIEFPCGPNVKKGDSVVVSAVGGGTLKAPMVVSSSGSGDRQQAQIDAAADVANATAQHFWADSNGAHVSTDADDPEGAQNALWNSLGMLFRKGADNLLAIVTGNSPGVLIYDGGGNAASNIVASFVGNLIELGKGSASAVIEFCGGMARIRYETAGAFFESANRKTWLRLREDTSGNFVAIGATEGTSGRTAFVQLDADTTQSRMSVSANNVKLTDAVANGRLRPVGVYSVTMTTPANGGADATVALQTQGGDSYVPTDASYAVILTPEGAPNGFTNIAYTVTNKTISGFTIHSYNDYSQPITQTINALVVHA